MQYRREIDGLRALAVLPVIMFHAGFDAFSGGFVGVDIFFVISGYLITSIIIAERETGSFSLIRFYERRARRILPALFLVMALCIPCAWLWLLPPDMHDFSESLAAVSVFSSNFLFWNQSGYFDSTAELKPLLHTWSLAVEEQYYLIFPLLLAVMWRFGKGRIVALLLGIAAASLAAAQWSAYNRPEAAFFLLPTRGWELAMGALTAFHLSRPDRVAPARVLSEIASAAGVLLIVYAIAAYDSSTPFPGFYALVPVIGTALIVLFTTSSTFIGAALGSKPLVGIGLISYSAYLWHQPLFAFARHSSMDEPGAAALLALSALALGLAWLSWRFVEQPFRQRGVIGRTRVFQFAIAGSAAFIAIGVAGAASNGFPARFTPVERQLLRSAEPVNVVKEMALFDLGRCFADQDQTYHTLVDNNCITETGAQPKVVLFGDSHAAHLLSGVREVFGRAGYKTEQWTAAACRATELARSTGRCRDAYSMFISYALPKIHASDVIIVSSNWAKEFQKVDDAELVASLAALFDSLRKSRASVVVVGSGPAFRVAPQSYMVREHLADDATVLLNANDNSHANDVLRRETRRAGFLFFDPSEALCRSQGFQSCLVRKDNEFLFLDGAHLSPRGSVLVMNSFWQQHGAALAVR